MRHNEPHSATACPDCGADNHCTLDANCWCMSKPRTGILPEEGACKCERCFARDVEPVTQPANKAC